MNGFVTYAPAPTSAEPLITSSAFWPSVNPQQIRDEHGIDGTVTAIRLRATIIEAIATANSGLQEWRTAIQLAGYSTLAAVPAENIDDVSINVNRYHRAVGCLTKALLIERYRDYDTTAAGNKKTDQLENPIDDLRRDANWAMNDIRGIRRTTVELI